MSHLPLFHLFFHCLSSQYKTYEVTIDATIHNYTNSNNVWSVSLFIHYIYLQTIKAINGWHQSLTFVYLPHSCLQKLIWIATQNIFYTQVFLDVFHYYASTITAWSCQKWLSKAINGRTDNTMTKRKRENNDLQNTTQKTEQHKCQYIPGWIKVFRTKNQFLLH